MSRLTLSIGDWCGVASGRHDTDGVQWVISKLEGWFDGPPSRTSFEDRPQHDGAYAAPEYAGARVVAVEGRIGVDRPDNREALWAARRRTQALLRHGPETLTVDGEGGRTQAQVYRSDKATCDPVGAYAYDFSLQATAPDPIRYSTTTEHGAVGMSAPETGGLVFPLSFPLSFGVGAAPSLLYLRNEGSADVAPVFTIPTTCDRPVLINPDNNGRLEYLDRIADGQQLVLNCRDQQVLLSGVPRRTRMGRCEFGAFTVPAHGTLRVRFDSLTIPTPGARLLADYRMGWW